MASRFDYPEWDTASSLAQKPIWNALSSQYANGAAGTITYVHPSDYVGQVWEKIELPIIKERLKSGDITNILEVFTNE